MEETNLQEKKKEVKEEKVEKKAEDKVEIPTGYYLAKVPTAFGNVIALDGKQVDAEELLIKIANAVEEAGLFK